MCKCGVLKSKQKLSGATPTLVTFKAIFRMKGRQDMAHLHKST